MLLNSKQSVLGKVEVYFIHNDIGWGGRHTSNKSCQYRVPWQTFLIFTGELHKLWNHKNLIREEEASQHEGREDDSARF